MRTIGRTLASFHRRYSGAFHTSKPFTPALDSSQPPGRKRVRPAPERFAVMRSPRSVNGVAAASMSFFFQEFHSLIDASVGAVSASTCRKYRAESSLRSKVVAISATVSGADTSESKG